MIESAPIRYARSGEVNVAYTVFGDGPVDLVFVPAFASHLEVSAEQPASARFLERLASFSRVIALEKRGTGLSDPVDHTPTLEEWVDDVRAVMDAVGSERAAVVGISEGGTTAVLFAATYPERTTHLILIATYAKFAWAPDYPFGVEKEAFERLTGAVAARWGDGVMADQWAPSRAGDPDFRAWWARYQRLSASPGMMRRLLEAYPDIDVRHVLPTIQAPTLVLHRRDDTLVDVGNGRYLAEHIPGARLVELEGRDHLYFIGDTESFLDEIQEFLTGVRQASEPDRVLATVMFTDIVESTRAASEMGDRRWRELLGRHDAVVRRQLERYRGREIKTLGDGFMAAFDGPARAIRCAHAVGEGVRPLGLAVRAGLHCGECEVVGDDLQGIAVNIAARVAPLAQPGEVLVSSTVKDLVAGAGFSFNERGAHSLKGVPGEWQLFAIAN